MSTLPNLIHEQSKSLTESDARRVLDFIAALKLSNSDPALTDPATASSDRSSVAPADVHQHGAAGRSDAPIPGTAGAALALLAGPRFSTRPSGSVDEIQRRIDALRQDWDRE